MSWEATNWVMDCSKNKGGDLFCLLLIANDMNSEGRGTFPTRSKLARQLRMPEPSVSRILHRLERSGELVCEVRGSGRERSQWRLPGVVSSGYANGARGINLRPQGSQIAIPGVAKRDPRGNKMAPVPLVYPVGEPPLPTNIPPPPPDAAAAAGKPSTHAAEKAPDEFVNFMARGKYPVDVLGAHRLWNACRSAAPWAGIELIQKAVEYKDPTLKGAHNPTGVLIRTVPAILQAWGPVEGP